MNKASKNIPAKYISAGAVATSEEELVSLSRSEIVSVRRRVAENEKTPHEVLAVLASDPSAEVRMSVALNKSTEPAVLNVLAADGDPDVRYRLASTSYIPQNLLRQLQDDPNPYVAARADTTLCRLSGKLRRIVSVFEFLSAEHASLADTLKRIVKDFSRWPLDKRFDEVVEVLYEIHKHSERQKVLCVDWIEQLSAESGTMRSVVRRSQVDHAEIEDQLADLIMQNVDDPRFQVGLQKLQARFQEHIEFSEKQLFAEVRESFSASALDAMNVSLNEMLLRGHLA